MSRLTDPRNTRMLKDIAAPYRTSLSMQQVYTGKLINIKLLIEFFEDEGVLDAAIVLKILDQSQKILSMEPNLVHLNDPVSIIGDIHGQFYDLVKILKLQNWDSCKQNFLFLGDYVDRGMFSIQTFLLVLALKINSPKRVIMLRGNHECRQLTTHFNFRTQCLENYNQATYDKFIEVFQYLPLAAIVNKKFLCLHGGISNSMQTVEDIMRINRFTQVPQSGLFCDLLWADPIDHPQGKLNGLVQINQSRGCSYKFGYSLSKSILQKNSISCIVRAHQAKQEGFQMHRWGGNDKFPPVVTVFSAPNYCDFYNNKGASIHIRENVFEIKQIQSASRPYYLPNNMTLFDWTIPFIAERISQIFYYLLKPDDTKAHPVDQIEVALIDKQKIIEQLLTLQQQEADEKMEVVKYNGKVLGEQLMNIYEAKDYVLHNPNKNFSLEVSIDKINEKRPFLDETEKQLIEDVSLSQSLIEP